jgi:MFS transporter, NNP family, nitrate/nitrite transporter
MQFRGFWKAGHTPSLLCAFLYFDISFMVWVLLGALANAIVPDPNFKLNEAERGLMIAIPLLGGAVLRVVLGIFTDHFGARRTALLGMLLTLVPLLLGWLWADSYPKLLFVGFLLGIAGASFSAALPLASRWYPPHYQGLAMGIAGAGNSGTALATFFGPRLAASVGWHAVFGLALIPMIATLAIFAVFAKDSPNQPPPKALRDYGAVLRQRDTWWFCLFYSITFGGFVGLASFLNSFFRVQYQLDPVTAGGYATLCVIAGSFLRPVGGYLADRLGGVRMLTALYLGVGTTMLGLSGLPPLWAGAVLMFLGMGMLGMGNGAVFQLVPQRFPREIGVLSGIVGAAGGVGGFFLPTLLGALKQTTGSFAGGFLTFAFAALASAGILAVVSRSWEGVFIAKGGRAATVAESPTPAAARDAVSTRPLPLPEPSSAV